MTYNILAQKYVQSGWHSYCKPRHLKWEYRKALLLEELEEYGSDIICLQEVEAQVFSNELQPWLAERGYRGHYLARQYGENVHGPPEGVALFYRTEVFELIQRRSFIFASVPTEPPAPLVPSLSSTDSEEANEPASATATTAAAATATAVADALGTAATATAAGAAAAVAATTGARTAGSSRRVPASSLTPMAPVSLAAAEDDGEAQRTDGKEEDPGTTGAAEAGREALGPSEGQQEPEAPGRSHLAQVRGSSPAVAVSSAPRSAIIAAAAAVAAGPSAPTSDVSDCETSSSNSNGRSRGGEGRAGGASSLGGARGDVPTADAGREGGLSDGTATAPPPVQAGFVSSTLSSQDEEPEPEPSVRQGQGQGVGSPPPDTDLDIPGPSNRGSTSTSSSSTSTSTSSSSSSSSSSGRSKGVHIGRGRGNNEFWSVFLRRQEGAILALLRHRPSQRPVLAAVTHLFWNPAFPDVKAFQAAVLCREMAAFLRTHVGNESPADVPVILAGDFNSLSRKRVPDVFDPKLPRGPDGLVSGVYKLLTSGLLPPDHPDHPASRRRPGETGNPDFRGMELSTAGIRLASAYSLANGSEPSLTTRTATFAGCLDYIFVSPQHFEVASTLDLPYDESRPDAVRDPLTDVAFSPIPNGTYPSDHLSLVALLRLKD